MKKIIACSLFSLLLASCGGDGGPTEPTPTPTPTPTPVPPRFTLRINWFPCCDNYGYIDMPGGNITVSPLPDYNKTYAANTEVTLTIVKYSGRYGGQVSGHDSFDVTDWGGTAIVIMDSDRHVKMQFFIS